MAGTITLDKLKEKMERGDDFTLVKTLPEMYYRHSHLPGAINLPPNQVAELASTLLPVKSVEIVVYCAQPT